MSSIIIGLVVLLLVSTAPLTISQGGSDDSLIRGAEYIDREIPENATVGAFNAGRLQYYSERDVVNLDGVINMRTYEAIRQSSLDCYIYQNNITYVVDFEIQSTNRLQDPSLVRAPVNLTVHDRIGLIAVMKVEPRSGNICK